MNLTPKHLIAFIAVFFSNYAFAQRNFVPGFIVTNSGDTIKGTIDYRNWERNPKSVTFISATSNTSKSYTSGELKMFSVADERYVSAVVKVDKSSDNLNDLKYSDELVLISEKAFLQTIVTGEKSFYYYKDEAGKDHFFIERDGKFEWLVHKSYLKNIDSRINQLHNNQYKQQLAVYLDGCDEIKTKFADLEYKLEKLQQLFQVYYRCSNLKMAFIKNKDKATLELGGVAGLSNTKLEFSGKGFEHLTTVSFPSSNSLIFGVSFNVVMPRNQKKGSIYNELLYSSYETEGRFNHYQDGDRYTIIQSSFNYAYLKVNSMFRYRFPLQGKVLFANAGLSNSFAIKHENLERKESKFYSTTTITEGRVLEKARKYEVGLLAGIGSYFKRLSVELRLEKANGMSTYNALRSVVTRGNVLFGYKF